MFVLLQQQTLDVAVSFCLFMSLSLSLCPCLCRDLKYLIYYLDYIVSLDVYIISYFYWPFMWPKSSNQNHLIISNSLLQKLESTFSVGLSCFKEIQRETELRDNTTKMDRPKCIFFCNHCHYLGFVLFINSTNVSCMYLIFCLFS